MTFDELWRLDLAKQQATLDSMNETDESDSLDCSAFIDSGIARMDEEEEIARFIQWLEESW